MMPNPVGIHLDAEVALFGPVCIRPRAPIVAFGFSERGMHGVVNAPRFFLEPRRDVFVVNVHVCRQTVVEGGVDGQAGQRQSAVVPCGKAGDVPEAKTEVGQQVNPTEGRFSQVTDAFASKQGSEVQGHARPSHG